MTDKPKPENFGYDPRGLENEGGWTQPDGEAAYYAALHEWEAEADAKTPEQAANVASIKTAAFQEGLETGKMVSVLRTIHAQPYEITVDVGTKYSAKGECQPECSIKIVRFLETGDNLTEIIKADVMRGTEELMAAVAEIQKRNVKP